MLLRQFPNVISVGFFEKNVTKEWMTIPSPFKILNQVSSVPSFFQAPQSQLT